MPPPAPQPQVSLDGYFPPPKKKPVGPILGVVIIVLLLILGGLYFWGERLNSQRAAQNQVPYILSGTTTITIKQ